MQQSSITVVVNIHREICTIFMAGGVPIETDKLLLCASIAGAKVVEITKLIKEAI